MSGSLVRSSAVSALRSVLFATVLVTGLSIGAGVGLAIWNNYVSGRYDTVQDTRARALATDVATNFTVVDETLTDLNVTLCAKIMGVNTTLQAEIAFIFSILNVTNTTGTNFTQYVINSLNVLNQNVTDLHNADLLINSTFTTITDGNTLMINMLKQNVSDLNATIYALTEPIPGIQANVTLLQMTLAGVQVNVTNLQNSVAAIIASLGNRIDTINSILPVSNNINLVAHTGLSINSSAAGTLDLYTSCLLSVNGLNASALTVSSLGTGILVSTSGPSTILVQNTGVTNVAAGTGIAVNANTGNLTVTNTGVLTVNSLPPTSNDIVVTSSGAGLSVTSMGSTVTFANTGVLSLIAGVGIGLSSASGNVTVTNLGLATFNSLSPAAGNINLISTVGLSVVNGGSTVTVNLANTAVTPGSYSNPTLTINAQGQVTAASNGSPASTPGLVSVQLSRSAMVVVNAGDHLVWNTVNWDPYSMFDGVSNVTIPTTGNYLVSYSGASALNTAMVGVVTNNAGLEFFTARGGASQLFNAQGVKQFNAGDVISIVSDATWTTDSSIVNWSWSVTKMS